MNTPSRTLMGMAALTSLALGCDAGQRDATDAEVPNPSPRRPVYEVEVRPDLPAGTVRAHWRLAFVTDEAATDETAFFLAGGLEIETLEGEGIRGFRTEASPAFEGWQQVVLELDEVEPGAPRVMELVYTGRPSFPPSDINRIAPNWVELSIDSGWHPLFAGFDQELTGVLRVALPEDWELVSTAPARYEDGHHVVRNTVPSLDVAFAAAPDLERVEGQRIAVVHRDGDPETVAAILEAGEACADYLNLRYGREDPLPVTALLMTDRRGSAYARINYIVLARVDPTNRIGLSRFVCHELAHYWTRGADFTTVHHWMSEAFAEYIAARYVRDTFGEDAYDALISRWEEIARDHGPVWTEEMTARGPDVVMYRRAPVLLARLEDRIGQEAFDRFAEAYMVNRLATTPELLEHLASIAGRDAADAFRALLESGPEQPAR